MDKNIKLKLRFDGTSYHGWQRQPGLPTVQGALEEAYKKLTGETILSAGCSRTDAGVHAREYVANFKTSGSIPPDKIYLALNTVLPPDIRIFHSQEAPTDFHARFSAKDKSYTYRVDCAEVSDPLISRYTYHFPYSLDLENMKNAALHLIGEYDFSAFMAAGGDQMTTLREVTALTICRTKNFLNIKITANAYLYNMVRIIAGTLLYVGCGKIPPDAIPRILQSRNRSLAGITAAPHGLFLEKVNY